MRNLSRILAVSCLALIAACTCAGDDDEEKDKGDTWTDPATSFTWQVERSEKLVWDDAVAYCENLELGGADLWRLPNIGELRTLIRGCPATEIGGACRIAADCLSSECESWDCDGCWSDEGGAEGYCFAPPELDHVCGEFWSTSQLEGYGLMGYIYFGDAMVSFGSTEIPRYARCLLTPW
ncbi:MAG: DUF1566 domain-containing protein [Deltaproteobacteria bacterium]|nr:DUF1566 domain-containing protein [Deltaproteobacteria bacterium]